MTPFHVTSFKYNLHTLSQYAYTDSSVRVLTLQVHPLYRTRSSPPMQLLQLFTFLVLERNYGVVYGNRLLIPAYSTIPHLYTLC